MNHQRMSNSRTALALALAALALLGSSCSKSGKIESHLQKADAFMQAENYAAAEIEFKNVLAIENLNPSAVAGMGWLYYEQGRFRHALPYLNAAKEQSPTDLANRQRAANVFMIAGLRDQARDDFKLILAEDPASPEAPLMLADLANTPALVAELEENLAQLPPTPAILTAQGSLLLKRNQVAAADARFDEALALDPSFAGAYSGKFAIHSIQKNPAEAEAALRRSAELSKPRSGMHLLYAQYLAQQKQDLPAATAHLAAQLEKAPDYVPLLASHADQLAQANRLPESKELTARALRLDPADPTSLRLQGLYQALEGKHAAAIATLGNLLQIAPKDVRANYQIALSHIALKEPAKAKPHLAEVVAAAPQNLEAAALLANIQLEERDASGAVITLKRLAEARPDSVDAKMLLAEAYNRLGNPNEALAIYRELERALPDNPELGFMSGVTQLRADDRSGARQSFESALSANPLHLQSVEQLTALDLSERSFDSALARVERSVELSPETAVLYVIKAQILNSMGQRDEAESHFRKALEIEPGNRPALTLLSRHYQQLGQSSEALATLKTLADANPEDVATLSAIATIHESQKQHAEAKAVYEKILAIDPKFVAALNNLAYLTSIKDGPTDRATELAERARAEAPRNPYVADTLGWILHRRGEHTRARALIAESATSLGELPEVQYHLGSVNYALGNEAEARASLQKATAAPEPFDGIDDARRLLTVLTLDPAQATDAQIAALQATAKDHPEDPLAQVRLGQLAARDGKLDAAVRHFQAALKSSSENLSAKIELAHALANQGNAAEALEIAKAAVRQAPNDPAAIFAQGKAAFLTGDHLWASSQLSGVSRQLADNAEVQLYLAQATLATGQLAAAKSAAQAAQALDSANAANAAEITAVANLLETPRSAAPAAPSDPNSLVGLLAAAYAANSVEAFEPVVAKYPEQAHAKARLAALLAADPKNADRVYQLATDARKRLADNPEVRALQGIARFHQGQFAQANQFFASVPANALSEPSWKLHYGLALAQTGDKPKATALLNDALAAGLAGADAQRARDSLAKLAAE